MPIEDRMQMRLREGSEVAQKWLRSLYSPNRKFERGFDGPDAIRTRDPRRVRAMS